MKHFFSWLADRLRPWYRNGLSEELQFPEIPGAAFLRGSMLRWACIGDGADMTFGVFELLGMEYVRRAARAWRPRELFLMEDVSLAFHEVEHHRSRGLAVDPIRFDRMVETLASYFTYLGETRTREQVRDLVRYYLDKHSVPDPEPDPAAFFRIAVDHPLLEELRRIDDEMVEHFPIEHGHFGLMDLGLILDSEMDESRYQHVTPLNCRTFASTGGEGVHFSLLVQDGAITEASPVIVTVPLMGSLIVGETLFEFLCLGCRLGFDRLEELAYEREKALEAYTRPDSQSRGSHDSDDSWSVSEGNRRLLDYLTARLSLQPWTQAARFDELQAKYGPVLRLPPS